MIPESLPDVLGRDPKLSQLFARVVLAQKADTVLKAALPGALAAGCRVVRLTEGEVLVFARHGRVAPHGRAWQAMMWQVFGLAPRVTHQLDISSLQGPLFAYQCACQPHHLSLRRHNKVQRGQSRYLCRHCGQPLVAA